MKLKLLDIDEYIKSNDLKPVTSTNIFSPGGVSFDPAGRWSEEIFGRVGSKERKSQFGYIDLKTRIINPVIFDILCSISAIFRNILLDKGTYKLSKEKKIFVEADEGGTGIGFFISNFEELDLLKASKPDKKDDAEFLNNNRHLIIINKYPILPAGVRDMSLTKSSSKQFSSEINDLYEKIISLSGQIVIENDEEFTTMFTTYIQKTALQTYKWLQSKVKGKTGVFQGSILKKTIDYSARIVATSSPNIPLGTIGIPWHTVLTLYQPFFFNYVYNKDPILKETIKNEMKIEDDMINIQSLQELGLKVTKNPNKISPELKTMLIKCAKDITEGKDILCKRDPVVSRASYYSAKIQVLTEGKAAVVNSLTVSPQGLDFDGDCLALLPVFTDEALKEAQSMNPSKAKSAWMNPLRVQNHHYTLTLDSIATIFAATSIER